MGRSDAGYDRNAYKRVHLRAPVPGAGGDAKRGEGINQLGKVTAGQQRLANITGLHPTVFTKEVRHKIGAAIAKMGDGNETINSLHPHELQGLIYQVIYGDRWLHSGFLGEDGDKS